MRIVLHFSSPVSKLLNQTEGQSESEDVPRQKPFTRDQRLSWTRTAALQGEHAEVEPYGIPAYSLV